MTSAANDTHSYSILIKPKKNKPISSADIFNLLTKNQREFIQVSSYTGYDGGTWIARHHSREAKQITMGRLREEQRRWGFEIEEIYTIAQEPRWNVVHEEKYNVPPGRIREAYDLR